jgi:predicted GNAT superfamily acetyltransferase
MTPPASASTAPDGIVFRSLSSLHDYEACIELQRVTWGRDFSDVVPLSILKIVQKAGGIVAGAFSPEGRMLGFVLGLAGVKAGRIFHWSHMLAVDPAVRDLGLGTRLKLYQRRVLLDEKVDEVQWTYDPLEARNANLNFNHLGVGVAEYVEDMYEGELFSDLAKGIGTDRFIVSWKIASERVLRALAGERPDSSRFREAPVANPGAETLELPDAPLVRIEIPESIQDVKTERPDEALNWRLSTRRAFEHYLGCGYRVDAFYRDPGEGRCFYGLEIS